MALSALQPPVELHPAQVELLKLIESGELDQASKLLAEAAAGSLDEQRKLAQAIPLLLSAAEQQRSRVRGSLRRLSDGGKAGAAYQSVAHGTRL